MAAVQQQGQNREERRDWLAFLKSRWFAESTWISALTKWILTLGGQAARLTMIVCTLYMSAELYPGVSLPAGLNVAVFIILSFALDVGGLGLAQIAKTARARGMEEEARRGEILANWLIIIMITGLVTVSLENAANMIHWSDDWKKSVLPATWAVVGVILSVARMICAVKYGHVLHALEKGMEQVEQRDEDERVSMRDQIANLQQRLAQQQQNATTAQANLQKENRALSQQVQDAEKQLHRLSLLQEQVADLDQNKQSASLQLQDAQQSVANLTARLQAANLQIADLQFGQRSTANLQKDNEELTANLQSAQLQIADLTVKLQTAKSRVSELQHADRETAKTRMVKPPAQSPANIMQFEQERAKREAAGGGRAKMSHAEVLAFKAANPDLKNADVAAKLGISERKVYDAIAWQREQESANQRESAQ